MSRPTFPDTPLSPEELHASLRFGAISVPVKRYQFEEVRETTVTLTYTVEARDEAEAHERMRYGEYARVEEAVEEIHGPPDDFEFLGEVEA